MKWRLYALLLALTMMIFGIAHAEGGVATLMQLNAPGMIVGVSQGSAAELTVRSELPEASVAYYTDNQTGYLAVAQGKADAFVYDYNQMRIAIENGVKGVHLLDETLGEPVRIAVGISPVSKIPELEDKLNQFIGELRADGTLDDMYLRWVINGDDAMPEIPAPENPAFTLVVGTSGIVPPYSYYVGTELAGYDIELAHRFAAWLGADLAFKVYDYSAIIPAAVTGDVDCIMADLNITEERAEALPFSDPLFEEKPGVMVAGEAAPATGGDGVHWQDYNGRTLGILTGTNMEAATLENFPDSGYLYLNGYPDCNAALLAGKIDGYLGDEPGLKSIHAEQPKIDYIHEYLTYNEYNFAFRKNDPKSDTLREELNAWLAQSWENGTMDEIDAIWFGVDEDRKVVDLSDLTGENGTIRVVTTSTDMPFSYIKDGGNVGYDIDVVARFCRDQGYALELIDVDFAARIPALQSGKADFTTSMNVTPEREEEVNFSNLVSSGGMVLAVRAEDLEHADATAAPTEGSAPELISYSDLNGKRVSMLNGAPFEELVRSKASEVAEFTYFNNMPDIILALQSGKTDAFLTNNAVAQLAVNRNNDLALFPESLQESGFGFAFAKGNPDRAAWQAAYDALPEGDLARAWAKWTGSDEDKKVLPEQDWPGLNGTVKVAACDTLEPMSYAGAGGEVVGFDIEVILMLAKQLDVHVEFTGMEFSSILSAVQSGKADIGTGSIIITEERKESVDFVEYYPAAFVLLVRREAAATAVAAGAYTTLSQLDGKRIGVMTGAIHDALVAQRLPGAQIVYFNAAADMLDALKAGKIDALVQPLSSAVFIRYEDGAFTWLDEALLGADVGFAFPKTEEGRALNTQFSDYIRALRANGELDALREKWFAEEESGKTMIDYTALPSTNGTLRLATTGTQMPFSYVRDNAVVGFEIELAARFCEENGYGLQVEQMNFDGILASVQAGKCDFACACLAITEERRESVDFAEPHFEESVVFMVLEGTAETPEAASGGIKSSFHKTFIRENRWKLFTQGVLTTLLITLLSILFGTLLGFGLFMLCRNGNPVANLVTRFCLWLVQGMPGVVLLMILYYVIFGSVAISGIAVAVIGFTLTFGAAVYGLLKMGVGAVDNGQYEAAYALGYSNRRTFFKIILPQALPHVLPAYRGEIVGLIKATAIVGYIAVQDLTKMGDIVRSRTYEAFFPLIAVTIIYFVLEALIGFLVSRIGVNFNPKRRKSADILKGVKSDD